MVKTVLPFDVTKWDQGSESNWRRKLSIRCKIGIGIGFLLSALVIAILVVCLIPMRVTDDDYWLPSYTSSSKLGVYHKAAISIDAAVCAPVAKQMFQKGGSAVDATIAALLCMGAVNPQSMGIGGGFLMTIYEKKTGTAHFIDAREMAPLKATEDMFRGNSTASEMGPLSIAVPGEIAGYKEAHQRFGNLNWSELFEPTIKMCKEGIIVTEHLDKHLKRYGERIKERPSIRNVFVNNETGEVYKKGDVIYRMDLAKTLETIANDGGDALYNPDHPLAKALLSDLKNIGSIIDENDLRQYKVRTTPPVRVHLDSNQTLYSAPIPGSGSLLAFMLNVLDGYGFSPETAKNKTESILYLHRMIETFKFAYAKRTELEDDLEGVKSLTDKLMSDEYAEYIRSLINDSTVLKNISDYGYKEDHGTAHLSLIAPNGDAVAATSTVNIYFGSLEMSPSTGILLNDEMDDFSSPNVTSYFDVAPYSRNRIRPGRRPMSSMCPTIVVDSDNNTRLVIGANGGTKITTAVLQVITRNLFLGEDMKKAIDAPRFHHQLIPDYVSAEDLFRKDMLDELRKLGHSVKDFGLGMLGIVMGVSREKDGLLYANSDYRKGGDVEGF